MGTIVKRTRKDGKAAFLAKISIMRDGKIALREHKTFDRRPAAAGWIARREEELSKPGALERAKVKTVRLADAIDRYIDESLKEIGKTKAQVLRTLKDYIIAEKACDKIDSTDIVALAKALSEDKQPQTVGNYLSHLGAVFTVAGPAWGYALNPKAMEDAQIVAKRLGLIGKSKHRERRPTLDELDKLMKHFTLRQTRRPESAPMPHLIAFAIFSTRRQEEIARITWTDFEEEHSRVLVRDMKNPGEKVGNNVWCDLPEPAVKIIRAMPKIDTLIFPHGAGAMSAAFTRACLFLAIDDLHFHDLRHDGISRLFEMGLNIPKVAAVSGHRSWTSLKRYTHIRESGDKYAKWGWLDAVTSPPPPQRRRLPGPRSAAP